jgi:hypothetical protein
MRTAATLSKTLDDEAPKFMKVAVVIGFENGDWFILASDPERAERLEELSLKGLATCLVGVTRIADQGAALVRFFAEYENKPEMQPYGQIVSAVFAMMCQKEPGRTKSFFVSTEQRSKK